MAYLENHNFKKLFGKCKAKSIHRHRIFFIYEYLNSRDRDAPLYSHYSTTMSLTGQLYSWTWQCFDTWSGTINLQDWLQKVLARTEAFAYNQNTLRHTSANDEMIYFYSFCFLQVVLVLLAPPTRIPLWAVSWFFRTMCGIIFPQNRQIYLRNLRDGWGCFEFMCPASKRTKPLRENCCHVILDESLNIK